MGLCVWKVFEISDQIIRTQDSDNYWYLKKYASYQWIEHCQLYKYAKFHSNRPTGSIHRSLICKTGQFKNGWKSIFYTFELLPVARLVWNFSEMCKIWFSTKNTNVNFDQLRCLNTIIWKSKKSIIFKFLDRYLTLITWSDPNNSYCIRKSVSKFIDVMKIVILFDSNTSM